MSNKVVPFPQANNFDMVKLFYKVISKSEDGLTKDEIIKQSKFSLSDRQFSYYISSSTWLELTEKDGKKWKLTSMGEKLSKLSDDEFIKNILLILYKDPIFRAVLSGREITQEIRMDANISSINTLNRRILTVRSWLKCFNILN